MYQRILIPLDASPADRAILDHIKVLAALCHSRVILLHVADGWAARRFGPEAVSPEITHDTAYLNQIEAELKSAGIPTTAELLYGDPKTQILSFLKENPCDLIAMSTHGHRFLGDLFLGTTATHVQHRVNIPVLLIRAKSDKEKSSS